MTAVVLLSRSTTLASLERTVEALADQTRLPERALIMAPAGLDDEVQEAARRAADRLPAGSVHSIFDTVGRSGAVHETLAQLEDSQDTPVEPEPAGPRPPRTIRGRSAAPRPSDSRGGRHVRSVDLDALERGRTQEAESLALVPERLRGSRRLTGRRAGTTGEGESWLWFLTEQTLPGREALEQLLSTANASPTTAVVGPKRVRFAPDDEAGDTGTADDADVLVDMGLTLTHSGRIVTGVETGEIDQGQSDWRQDVLAVALPGMLVRERTLRVTDGLDADLPEPWAEIDLCRRVWRGGERVAVRSSARALAPRSLQPRAQQLLERRTGETLLLIKHRPTALALLTLMLAPLLTLLRMIRAIAASEPRRIPIEARALVEIMRRAPRVMRRGARDRRRARVPTRRLAPLYLPRGEGVRQGAENALTSLFADDDRTRRARLTAWGIAGTRHGIDDADYGRHITWTVAVAVLATGLGLVSLRGLFGRGELAGPGLLPLPERWESIREAAWASWVPAGLGARGPADPLVRLLGQLPAGGPVLVEAIIFAALPASALFAWWAAGAITRAVGARLAMAVVWAVSPPLLSALTLGAWPLLLVHMLLPLLALCIGRAIGLPFKERWASVPAAAAGGLLLLVIGAVAPALVVLTAVALALIAPAVPGRRLRLLWVLLPSLALHLPYLAVYIGSPRLLLGVGAVTPTSGPVDQADLLALWPTAPPVRSFLVSQVGQTGAQLLLMLPLILVLLAALASPFLRGDAGRAGRFGALLATVCLLAVLAARQAPMAVAGDVVVPASLHALLSALLLALCVAAAAVFDALARREGGISRLRRAVTSGAAAVVAVVCVAAVAGWVVALPDALRVDRVQGTAVPAAAADQGRTDARARVLVLRPMEDGTVQAEVVVHGEDSAIQHAAIVSLRETDRARGGEPVDSDPGSEALRRAVTDILTPAGGEGPSSPLALAYVVVPGDPEQSAGIVDSLDASTRVEKVTQNASGGMWRVIDATPRVWVEGGTDPGGTVPIASDVIGASGELAASDQVRTVVLSERLDPQWRATLDGTELEEVPVDGWAQGFVVPEGAEGRLVVGREQPWRPLWQVLLYSATALTALIAVPWRGRSRLGEETDG